LRQLLLLGLSLQLFLALVFRLPFMLVLIIRGRVHMHIGVVGVDVCETFIISIFGKE
jgi:hypothetical protein